MERWQLIGLPIKQTHDKQTCKHCDQPGGNNLITYAFIWIN